MRQASELLDQSYYVRQLGCAVGGVLVLIAKSEWRGGDQKKWKKWNLTCLIYSFNSEVSGEVNKIFESKETKFTFLIQLCLERGVQ